jgi:hypothetical protein
MTKTAQERREAKKIASAKYRASHVAEASAATAKWKCENKYGISIEIKKDMLSAQMGECFICDGPIELYSANVDHDHRYGNNWWAVRGLLCHKCNKGLGCFNDDQTLCLKAAEYLRAA